MNFKSNPLFYLAAGGFFFILWLLIVFPYDALESRFITEIENQTGGQYRFKMKDIDVSLFGNVELTGLQIFERSQGKEILLLKTPELNLDFSPFALLSQKLDFNFTLAGQKTGEIEGSLSQDGDKLELELEFDHYPLEDWAFLKGKTDVLLRGTLEGKLELRLNAADSKSNQGKIDIKLVNLSVDPTKILLDPSDPNSAMELPKITLSKKKGSHIKGKLQQNKFELESITLKGGDLDLDLKGRLTLRPNNLKRSRLSVKGVFRISDSLIQSVPLLGLLEAQKNEKGEYPLRLSGRLENPKIRIGKFWVRR